MDSWNTSFLLGLPIFSGFCYWFHGVYVWKKQLGRRSLNDRTAKVSTSPKGKHLPWKEGLRMVLLRVLINHVQCRIKIEHPKAECGSWTCSPGQGNLFWKPSFSASSGSCRAFKKKHHATSWDSVHFPCISLKFVVMTFPFPKQWCSLFPLPPPKKKQKHTTQCLGVKNRSSDLKKSGFADGSRKWPKPETPQGSHRGHFWDLFFLLLDPPLTEGREGSNTCGFPYKSTRQTCPRTPNCIGKCPTTLRT